MPLFEDKWPERQILVLTEDAPGSVVKSRRETLEIGEPGQPDKLILHYDAFFTSRAALNAWLIAQTIGTNRSAVAETAGTWIGGPARVASREEEEPFYRLVIPCLGLATAKPDAVRWFAVTESQTGENILYLGTLWPKLQAEIIGYGVEIDRVVLGSQPNMSQVGTALAPSPAPSVRPSVWTSIADPVRQYPDGWFLADLRTQRIYGSSTAWLCTYVYRYKYPLTP